MSNADNYRYDDWAFHRALEEKAGDRFREVLAGVIEVGRARIFHRGLHGLPDDEACLVHEVLVVAQVHKAARDDVGGFVEFAGASVDGRDDDAETFLSERLSVAHEDIGEFRNGVSLDDPQFRWRGRRGRATCSDSRGPE